MFIDVKGLSFGYAGKRDVFRALDIAIPEGPVVLLGPNGAGKTSLLSLLAGVLRPRRGSIRVGTGEDLGPARRRAEVGWLPQDVPVVPGMTVAQQIAYSGWLKGMTIRAARKAAPAAMEAANLTSLANRKASRLSGGQRRRLGIGQALVNNPAVLLLDEPYAGLDPEQRASVRQTLLRIAPSTGIVVSTHQTEDIEDVYRQTVILSEGRVRYQGTIDEFLDLADSISPGLGRAESAYRAIMSQYSAV
ncbi:ATP-binding cassette domain-containing protein [Agromyces archimandritae]|uniref:ATP-binding cassette domain-containing protein n=1 Tax=Agromyces archimandritae TaxID=2781962 RepID=A0A975FLJ6_9MICO|nr:ATP-binding cassette domain-containing protein [Agromyces archimandritae]QTX03962.1 ATP-binding cassette domain-containing protein [Agromyces archimandritae]